MDKNNSLLPLKDAVEVINIAILQGQYEALKDVNRVQLAVYYVIGELTTSCKRYQISRLQEAFGRSHL